MSRFRSVFRQRHVVLPIINVSGPEQALRNVRVARDNLADGAVLLGHHGLADRKLLDILADVSAKEPGFWLGVNCVGLSVAEVFRAIDPAVSGVWVDDALIDESADAQPAAEEVRAVQRERGWAGLYFGGVAMKYQRPVRDAAAAAARAAALMDVVTTSGPGTGLAAKPEKVRAMKAAAGETPLAVASGVTPENVSDYLRTADCFLVSTGISLTQEELDPPRLRALTRVVRESRYAG